MGRAVEPAASVENDPLRTTFARDESYPRPVKLCRTNSPDGFDSPNAANAWCLAEVSPSSPLRSCAAGVAYLTRHRENSIDCVSLIPARNSYRFIVAGDPVNEELIGPSSAAWSRRPGGWQSCLCHKRRRHRFTAARWCATAGQVAARGAPGAAGGPSIIVFTRAPRGTGERALTNKQTLDKYRRSNPTRGRLV